jgi:hypothetical protein
MTPRTPIYIYLLGFIFGCLSAWMLSSIFPFLGTGAGMATMILCIALSLPYTMLLVTLRRRMIDMLKRKAAARNENQNAN